MFRDTRPTRFIVWKIVIYTYTRRLLISDLLLLETRNKSRVVADVLSPNHRRLIAAKWKIRDWNGSKSDAFIRMFKLSSSWFAVTSRLAGL